MHQSSLAVIVRPPHSQSDSQSAEFGIHSAAQIGHFDWQMDSYLVVDSYLPYFAYSVVPSIVVSDIAFAFVLVAVPIVDSRAQPFVAIESIASTVPCYCYSHSLASFWLSAVAMP